MSAEEFPHERVRDGEGDAVPEAAVPSPAVAAVTVSMARHASVTSFCSPMNAKPACRICRVSFRFHDE